MKVKILLKIISALLILIFAYLLYGSFLQGISLPPSGGDSYWYHVPIAKNILSGNFIFQRNIVEIEQWYPGSSEAILAILIALHVPVNLFNVLGILILSIVLYSFGKFFLKDSFLSLVFSLSLITCYGVFRLALTQNIDIWLTIYLLIIIMFLENIKNNNRYFLMIGFFSGLIIGSKYSAPLFLLVLFFVYGKELIKNINPTRLILFLVPFSIFGLFWYVRNLVLTGSPVYPQTVLFFKGLPGWRSYLSMPIWKAFVYTPKLVFNAYVSEFLFWPVLYFIIPLFLFYVSKYRIKRWTIEPDKRIVLIVFLFFAVYLFLPYDGLYEGIVLSVRYIYVIFILSSLLVFLIAKRLKLQEILSIILLFQTAVLFYQPYHPKLVFVFEPLILIFILIVKYRKKVVKVLT